MGGGIDIIRLPMSAADAHYAGALVDGARTMSLKQWGDRMQKDVGLRVAPAMTGLLLFVMLFLVACGRCNALYEPYMPDYAVEQTIIMPDYIPEITESARELIITIPDLPPEISEYGFRAAVEFLDTMTSIRTGVYRAMFEWDNEQRVSVATGEFSRWDRQSHEWMQTFETPEIYFSPGGVVGFGFFDQHNNRIESAAWIMYENYADYFRLFSFDDSGIPVILVHFSQTVDAGYGGFYQVFRYVNGVYRMLQTRSFEDGIESPWGWLSIVHDLFVDENGRIITFAHTEYHGIFEYTHLKLTDTCAEMHLISRLDDWERWQEWVDFHWVEWDSERITFDSWQNHNPTIFGTDIAITPVQSFPELEEYILQILRRS